jgi:transposase-like zinc ribbon protein/ISXO2 transposase-like protein
VPHPVPGVDYPQSWREVFAWFPDDASCLAYLGRLRWPAGFACPSCGNGTSWRMGRGLLRCSACDRRTSATAGTIFAGTRSPLSLWFAAAWYITNQKAGVSALGLQRALELGSYETAWAWLHKFRRAMVRPGRDKLAGEVEVDETYVGGVAPGKHGRGAEKKTPVLIAVEKRGRGGVLVADAGRALGHAPLEDPGRARERDLRVHRGLPQPPPAPLEPRHADTDRIWIEQHQHHNRGSLSQET